MRLEVHITELGALEIYCVDAEPPNETLEARVRHALGRRRAGAPRTPPTPRRTRRPTRRRRRIQAAFTTGAGLPTLTRDLETLLEARRDEWSMMTARALFDALVEVAADRKKTADHEQRWLNLAGFLLRPGTGAPLDTWRSRVMWGVFNEDLAHPKSEPGKLAWWIAWRRIAGGLAKGQQDQIYDRLAQLLLPSPKQAKKLAEVKPSKQELAEMWRAVASLERLPVQHKVKLGDELMRRMDTRKGREDAVHLWALSRLGARVPLYGPLNAVVPPSKVNEWLDAAARVGLARARQGRRSRSRSSAAAPAIARAISTTRRARKLADAAARDARRRARGRARRAGRRARGARGARRARRHAARRPQARASTTSAADGRDLRPSTRQRPRSKPKSSATTDRPSCRHVASAPGDVDLLIVCGCRCSS